MRAMHLEIGVRIRPEQLAGGEFEAVPEKAGRMVFHRQVDQDGLVVGAGQRGTVVGHVARAHGIRHRLHFGQVVFGRASGSEPIRRERFQFLVLRVERVECQIRAEVERPTVAARAEDRAGPLLDLFRLPLPISVQIGPELRSSLVVAQLRPQRIPGVAETLPNLDAAFAVSHLVGHEIEFAV